jgi:hypothetical protein
LGYYSSLKFRVVKKLLLLAAITGVTLQVHAQKVSSSKVPEAAKSAFMEAHPTVSHIVWETENGNFEGNWKAGGFDHSAMYTPQGKFAGSETDINPDKLPATARQYVKTHLHTRIKEASLDVDASGNKTYEADVKGKAYIFDTRGNFKKEGEGD